ncbi:MAG TPA: Uma2 family endonuclease [Bradyrhizobium sp.]|jgi:Uma2 family endonuclease|nr:Uma2 family endonuclease [Bradyrhizobium sp.]
MTVDIVELAALSFGCYLECMQPSAVQTISPEQFFAWVVGQEERFELVEGEIVTMAGAGRRHDSIVVNLTAAVHSQVRAGPCQTFTGDTYVSTSPSTRRMADLGIDCGKPDDDSLSADKPALVIEVLSPTTGGFDLTVKLAEYQSLPSMDYILFVDTETPNAHLYFRDKDGRWEDRVIKGLDATIDLPKLKVVLKLAEIYEGLQFRERPKLVEIASQQDQTTGGFH